MSFISQFINHYYQKLNSNSSNHYRISFFGIDCSGKTSLLYLLKEHETVTVIPTIGFNVEEFTPPTASSEASDQHISMTGWDIGTGCGFDRLIGVMEMYLREGDALIWVVDSTDRERMSESRQHLQYLVSSLDFEELKVMPILILANKQDLPNAQSIDEVRSTFYGIIRGKIAAIFPTSLVRGLGPESGIPQAFDWLKIAIPIARSGGTNVPQINETPIPQSLPHQINVRSPGNLGQKLNDWLGRIQGDSAPEEFLSRFDQVALPQWDHYTHIQLAFLILKIHGRQKGKDMIFKGIQKYITESKGAQTTGRSYHTTMTYFWIQMVHFGIQNATLENTTDSMGEGDLDEEFARFLLVNPHMVDGQLWKDYYSKDVIMTPDARTRMVLPDKKALPSIPARHLINKLSIP